MQVFKSDTHTRNSGHVAEEFKARVLWASVDGLSAARIAQELGTTDNFIKAKQRVWRHEIMELMDGKKPSEELAEVWKAEGTASDAETARAVPEFAARWAEKNGIPLDAVREAIAPSNGGRGTRPMSDSTVMLLMLAADGAKDAEIAERIGSDAKKVSGLRYAHKSRITQLRRLCGYADEPAKEKSAKAKVEKVAAEEPAWKRELRLVNALIGALRACRDAGVDMGCVDVDIDQSIRDAVEFRRVQFEEFIDWEAMGV